MLKKRILLALVLGAIAILVFVIINRARNRPSPVPPITTALPKLEIPAGYSTEKPFLTFNPNITFQAPSSLRVYKIERSEWTREEAMQIASNLGVNENFFETKDAIFGTLFLFYGESSSLRIAPSQHIIDFKYFNITEEALSPVPASAQLEQIAKNFLLDKKVVSDLNGLSVNKAGPLSIRMHMDENTNLPPNAASVSFLTKIDGYPLYGSSYSTGVISVTLNSNLEVFSLYADLPEKVVPDVYSPTKSLSYLAENGSSEAVIQSLDDGEIDVSDISGNLVQHILVNEIEIGYLQELRNDAEYLQPVFHLKGLATLSSGRAVAVALYIPAVLSNQ